MSLLDAVILGIIQGISEFLPISSSGHLILFQNLLRIQEPTMTFDILLHVATLIPILAVYWTDVLNLIKRPFQKLTGLLIVATLPAVLLTVLFKDQIDMLFSSEKLWFLAVGFTITGMLLLYADKVKTGDKKTEDITYTDALIIGAVQGVAITPSISRSGSTISTALFRKLDRKTAAKFSFLMSIPAIAGAVCLEIIKLIKTPPVAGDVTISPLCMLAGFVAAMLSGYLAINFMLDLIRKAKLKYFAFYVFALAVLIITDTFILNGFIFG